MRGNLRQSSLADVLRHAYAERKSGVLHLSRETAGTRVHLKKGVPIFADAGDSPHLSRDQAETLFYSLFSWTSGEFSFEDLEPTVDEGRAFTGSASVMILEGSRRIAEVSILEHLIGGPESVFACAQSSSLPLFTMKLSPEESAVLKLARERGRFTARDLPASPDTLDVIRSLNVLVSVGLLELVKKAPVPEPPPRAPEPAPRPRAADPPPPVPEPSRRAVEKRVDTFERKRGSAPAGIRKKPARKKAVVAFVLLLAAAIAVASGLSLSLRREEAHRPDAGDLAPPAPAPVAAVPQPVSPEPPAETHAEPTDAELFYAANVAFQSEDYEQSKAALDALLARRPDFTAARELMGRVERALAPKPSVAEERRTSRKAVEKLTEPEPPPKPAKAPPNPAELFESARSALARAELETAQARLEVLEAVEPSYPGASNLREELALRFWERKLPLVFHVRHDHALGSCSGVLELTSSGFHYRSKEHEWTWSFADVVETERRTQTRLRIETTKGTSYNFELKEPPSDDDWARHQRLWRR